MEQFVFDGIEFESEMSNVKMVLNNIVKFNNRGGIMIADNNLNKINCFGEDTLNVYKMVSISNSSIYIGCIIIKEYQIIILKNYDPVILSFKSDNDWRAMLALLIK